MKTSALFVLSALATLALFIQARKSDEAVTIRQTVDTVVVYTAEVRAIIDQKCFGCHNPEAKNEKAKKKLMWDDLPKIAKQKQLKTMNDMLEVLGEGGMPPEKFLQFKPEAKLTEAETKTLTAWADTNARKLSQ